MLFLRSLIFNAVFYINLIAFMVFGCVFYITPRKWSIRALQTWARASLWWLKIICGTTYEVRGREHIPDGPALVAGKHQSLWETFALLPLVDDPAVVLKHELTWIPLFGWFALKFKMLPVDRDAGAGALQHLIGHAKEAVATNRQIIIFPEGTRRPPGAEPAYKPGAAALYLNLDVPCIPFALNSGLYWPRRKFLRYPGKIVIEFLPAIPAGLKRREYSQKLEQAIETATVKLVHEAPNSPLAPLYRLET